MGLRSEDPEMILVNAGIDPEKMEFLHYEERVEILIKAGLNPMDYDF